MRCQASGMPAPGWCSSSLTSATPPAAQRRSRLSPALAQGVRVERVGLDLPAGDGAGPLDDRVVERDAATLDAVAVADGHRTRLHVAVARDEHERHLLLLRVQDLLLHPVVGPVDLGTDALAGQPLDDPLQVVDVVRADRDADYLHRREPGGERTGVVLGEYTEEPLDRPELRGVDHHRLMALTISALVLQPEPRRLVEVVLDRRHLPGAADRV